MVLPGLRGISIEPGCIKATDQTAGMQRANLVLYGYRCRDLH